MIKTKSMNDEQLKMRQLAALPRRPNRAHVHLIQYDDFYFDYDVDELPEITSNDALHAFLSKPNIDLKRGDFVCYDFYLGYRNEGKAIYDGTKIVDLSFDPDDYGSIPEEFQVIVEFPPMYWSEVIDNNNNVPFNFKMNIGHVNADDIIVLMLDNKKYLLAIPVMDSNGLYYYIFDHKIVDHVRDAAPSFIKNLLDTKWLQFYDNDEYGFFPLTSSQINKHNLNPEVLLALDPGLVE